MWLLLGLFVAFGWEGWRNVPSRSWAFAAAAVIVCSTLISWRQMGSYREEPGRRAQQLNFHDNSLFSSFPVISSSGLFFQSMDPDRYVVRWVHESNLDEISSKGNAFRPIRLPDGFTIGVEESYRGSSTMLRFDPATKQLTPLDLPVPTDDEPPSAASPDGKWLAYASNETGFQHLWLRNLATGQQISIAGGNCDSSWPAWELDSHALLFASDCGRAVGLPALYRFEIPTQ